jgi:hypothetical protein
LSILSHFSTRKYIVSCVCQDEEELNEIGEFHKTQGGQWVLTSEGNPLAIIKKSDEKRGENVPSSDMGDWERIIGMYDESVFLDHLKKCYDKL